MAKEKAKSSDFNFDDPFFSGSDDFNFDLPPVDKGRKPDSSLEKIRKIMKASGKGALDSVTESSFVDKAIRTALPSAYGEVKDMYEETRNEMKEIYRKSYQNIKPQLHDLAQAGQKLAGKETKWAKMLQKIERATSSSSSYYSEGRDDTIRRDLDSIFIRQEAQREKERNEELGKERVQEAVSEKRHRDLATLLNLVQKNTSKQIQYTERITSVYQRKSLELQYKTFYAITDLLKETNRANQVSARLLEGINKNTGLPDFVKMNKKEHVNRFIKNGFKAMGSYALNSSSDYLKRIKTNAMGNLSDMLSGIEMGISAAAMGGNLAGSAGDMDDLMGGEKKSMGEKVAGLGAGAISQQIALKYADKLKKRIFKGTKTGKRIDSLSSAGVTRLPRIINELLKKDVYDGTIKGDVLTMLQGLFGEGSGISTKMNKSIQLGNLGEPTQLNNQAIKSINEVIPGYLSLMLRELQGIRTGKETDLTVYDFKEGKFSDKKSLVTRMGFDLLNKRSAKYNRENLQKLVSDVGGANLSPAARQHLASSLTSQSLNMRDASIERLTNASTWGKHGDEISSMFKDYFQAHNGKLQQSPEAASRYNDFVTKYGELGNALGDSRAVVQELVNAGYSDLLQQAGILTKDGNYNLKALIATHSSLNGKDKSPLGIHLPQHKTQQFGGGTNTTHIQNKFDTSKIEALLSQQQTRQNPVIQQVQNTGLGENNGPRIDKTNEILTLIEENTRAGVQITQLSSEDLASQIREALREAFSFNTDGVKEQVSGFGGHTKAAASEGWKNVKSGYHSAKGFTSNKWSHLKDWWKEDSSFAGRAKKRAKTFAESAKQSSLKAANEIKRKGGSLLSTITSENFPNDIYIGEEQTPRLLAEKMAKGHYLDSSSNKLIRSLKDVKSAIGSIVDTTTGQTCIKPEEFGSVWTVYPDKGELKIKMLSVASYISGRAFQKGLEFTNRAKATISLIPAKIKELIGTGKVWANRVLGWTIDRPIDIYVVGEDKPRILSIVMSNGGYFSKRTGQAIVRPSQIDGDVLDGFGNTVLSLSDMQKGLIDIHGRPIKSLQEKVFEFAAQGLKRLGGKIRQGFGSLRNALTGAKNKAVDFVHYGTQGKPGVIRVETGDPDHPYSYVPHLGKSTTGKQTIIEEIRDLLLERLPKPKNKKFNDVDGDGLRDGSVAEQEKQKEKKKKKDDTKQSMSMKDMVAGFTEALKNKDKKNILDKLTDKVGGLFSSAFGFLTDMVENLLFAKLGGKFFGKKAAEGAAEVVAKEGVKKAGLLSKIGSGALGVLGTVGLTGLKGIKGLLTSRFGAKAGEEMAKEASKNPGFLKSLMSLLGAGALKAGKALGPGMSYGWGPSLAIGKGIKAGGKNLLNTGRWMANTLPGRAVGSTLKGGAGLLGKGVLGGLKYTGGLVGGLGTATKALAGAGLKAVPLAGTLWSGYDTVKDLQAGNYGSALFDASMTGLGVAGMGGLSGTASLATGALGGLATAGTALVSAVGLPALLAGGALVGGYYTYKHFVKNNVKDFDKLRYIQYGFSSENTKFAGQMKDLEDISAKATTYSGGRANFSQKLFDGKKALEVFGLDRNAKDTEGLTKLENYKRWLLGRFLPVWLHHATELVNVTKKYKPNDENKLTDEEKGQLLDKVKWPEGPYNEMVSPTPDLKALESGPKEVANYASELDKKYEKFKNSKTKKEGNASKVAGVGAVTAKAALNGTKDDPNKKAKERSVENKISSFLKDTLGMNDWWSKNIGKVGGAIASGMELVGKSLVDFFVPNAMAGEANAIASYLDSIRYRAYGLKDLDSAKVESIKKLELACDKSSVFKSGAATLLQDPSFILKQTAGDFGFTDLSGDQAKAWITWFTKRFLVIYLGYRNALLNQTGQQDRVKAEKLLKQEKAFPVAKTILYFPDIWHITISPWPGYELNTDAKTVDTYVNQLQQFAEKTKLREQNPTKNKQDVNKGNAKKVDDGLPKNAQTKKMDLTGSDAKFAQYVRPDAESPDLGKGGGSSMGAPGTKNSAGAVSLAGLKTAGGEIKDGAAGMKFVKFKDGAKLDGMNPTMRSLLLGMIQEYGEATGKTVTITSGFRSMQEQAELYRTKPKGKAAKPGASMHEFGLAVDINSTDVDEMEKLGLMRKYGFTRPVGEETWHVEPAGTQQNYSQYKKDQAGASKAIQNGIGHGGGGKGSRKGLGNGRDPELQARIFNSTTGVINDNNKAASTLKNIGGASTEYKTSPAQKGGAGGYAGSVASAGGNQARSVDIGTSGRISKSSSGSGGYAALGGASNDGGKYNTTGQGSGSYASVPKPKGDGYAGVKDTIIAAAKVVGVDPNLMLAMAAQESGFRIGVNAKGSSAKGLFQFISGTWRAMLNKYGKKYGIPANASATDPVANSILGAAYVLDNARAMGKTNPTPGEAYLAHFAGPGGAKSLLRNPGAPITQTLSSSAVRQFIGQFGGRVPTGSEFVAYLQNLIANKLKKFSNGASSVGTMSYSPLGKYEQNSSSAYGSNLPQHRGAYNNRNSQSSSNGSGYTPQPQRQSAPMQIGNDLPSSGGYGGFGQTPQVQQRQTETLDPREQGLKSLLKNTPIGHGKTMDLSGLTGLFGLNNNPSKTNIQNTGNNTDLVKTTNTIAELMQKSVEIQTQSAGYLKGILDVISAQGKMSTSNAASKTDSPQVGNTGGSIFSQTNSNKTNDIGKLPIDLSASSAFSIS